MRQESNIQLPQFNIDIGENGDCTVFFNELIATETKEEEGTEKTTYVYSTYVLKTVHRANLEHDIETNYELWLSHVKEIDRITVSAEMRKRRNELLADSDYTQVEDADLTAEQKQAFKTYRQNLRNLPEQIGFPYDIEWPQKPEV